MFFLRCNILPLDIAITVAMPLAPLPILSTEVVALFDCDSGAKVIVVSTSHQLCLKTFKLIDCGRYSSFLKRGSNTISERNSFHLIYFGNSWKDILNEHN